MTLVYYRYCVRITKNGCCLLKTHFVFSFVYLGLIWTQSKLEVITYGSCAAHNDKVSGPNAAHN